MVYSYQERVCWYAFAISICFGWSVDEALRRCGYSQKGFNWRVVNGQKAIRKRKNKQQA